MENFNELYEGTIDFNKESIRESRKTSPRKIKEAEKHYSDEKNLFRESKINEANGRYSKEVIKARNELFNSLVYLDDSLSSSYDGSNGQSQNDQAVATLRKDIENMKKEYPSIFDFMSFIKKSKLITEAEAKVDIKKIIKDMQGDFGGDNTKQLGGLQMLKGLATSEDPLANKVMKKLNTAMTDISKEVLGGDSKKESVLKEGKVTFSDLLNIMNNIESKYNVKSNVTGHSDKEMAIHIQSCDNINSIKFSIVSDLKKEKVSIVSSKIINISQGEVLNSIEGCNPEEELLIIVKNII